MRIGILTQPLYTNYGGLLQCYALQSILKKMGHEAIVLQREHNRQYSFLGALVYYLKHFVKLILGRHSSWHYYVSQGRRDYIAKNTCQFIEKFIVPRSKQCYTTDQLAKEVDSLRLNAIVVGSDQVWRPYYSPCQENFFCDFLPKDSSIKRIAYGASFGTKEWLFSPKLTARCASLVQSFCAVSVREDSGIELCQKYLKTDAVQVLDPTMLLEPTDYYNLLPTPIPKKENSLFCYLLNRSFEKQKIIETVAMKLGLLPFEIMPPKQDSADNLYKCIEACVYNPVEDWLSAFIQAEMVLTDSFHGVVFSIIFNKPFWVIENQERGAARFESILRCFHLENRLISQSNFSDLEWSLPIDWEKINSKRSICQKDSMTYLQRALLS